MAFLTALWAPILLSAILVFLASAIAWTMLPFHNKEWKGLPNQDAVRAAMGQPAPGLYMLPFFPDPAERRGKPAMESLATGPSGYVTIMRRGPITMAPTMVKSLLADLLIAVFVAYVAWLALPHPGATYIQVFRLVSTVAFMAFAFGSIQDSIWFSRPWRSWLLQAIDALVFGMLVGGTFGWLWPR